MIKESEWMLSTSIPVLEDHSTDVWRVVLPFKKNILASLQCHLSVDELSRMEKFHFEKHRNHFIVARGILRELLAGYLNQSPRNIVFSYTEYGRPYINNVDLNFNLSHSDDCILYAITQNQRVGIDVEKLKAEIDYLSIAEEFFTKNEYAKLKNIPIEEQCLAFYRCWTRKEAYVKTMGQGLSYPLNQVEVSLLTLEQAKILTALNSADTGLNLKEIIPLSNHVATLITEFEVPELRLWNWQPSC